LFVNRFTFHLRFVRQTRLQAISRTSWRDTYYVSCPALDAAVVLLVRSAPCRRVHSDCDMAVYPNIYNAFEVPEMKFLTLNNVYTLYDVQLLLTAIAIVVWHWPWLYLYDCILNISIYMILLNSSSWDRAVNRTIWLYNNDNLKLRDKYTSYRFIRIIVMIYFERRLVVSSMWPRKLSLYIIYK